MTEEQMRALAEKPSREQIEAVIRNDGIRAFKVDIESSSTVRGDAMKNQQEQAAFLNGTASYMAAVGPLVQSGAMPQELAVEIYAGFSRSFNLGKQAEDSLDQLADTARKNRGQAKPPSEAEQKMMLEKAKLDLAKKGKAVELRFSQEQHRNELEMKQEELRMKQEEHEFKIRAQREELDLKREEMAMKREEMELHNALERDRLAQDHTFKTQDLDLKIDRDGFDRDQAKQAAFIQQQQGRKR